MRKQLWQFRVYSNKKTFRQPPLPHPPTLHQNTGCIHFREIYKFWEMFATESPAEKEEVLELVSKFNRIVLSVNANLQWMLAT